MRTYPDLSAKCIKFRLDLPLRLWYLLRPAYGGRGWVTLDDAYRLSCGNRRQTRRWIRQGMDVFWIKDDQGRLWLAGLGTLCERLGVIPWQGTVEIPIEDIQSLERFRACLYASWFSFKPRMISREKLSGIFGRSKVTLLKWEKIAGVTVQKNVAWSEIPKDGDYSKFPIGVLKALGIRNDASEETKSGYAWLESWGRRPREKKSKPSPSPGVVYGDHIIFKVICWQLPNTYNFTSFPTQKPTALQRKARQRVRHTPDLEPGAKVAHRRIFFSADYRGTGMNKALQSGGIAYQAEGLKHYGARLWNFNYA